MEQYSFGELSQAFSEIGTRLARQDDSDEVLRMLTEMAVAQVPGAEYAGITIGGGTRRFVTVAATSDLVHRTDAIQYELGSGPCVDAVVKQKTFKASDLRTDPRWPDFGRRTVEATGITSMLSLRLFIETDTSMIAGLNTYSHAPDAFDEVSETVATLLATHGALAVTSADARTKARNLLIALEHSREIGTAVGIIMALRKVTREQGFDILRLASQHTHRKLSDIAADVVHTGAVPDVPTSRSNGQDHPASQP